MSSSLMRLVAYNCYLVNLCTNAECHLQESLVECYNIVSSKKIFKVFILLGICLHLD